jgi:hypothetical protein
MADRYRFHFMDGRMVDASSPVAFFDGLRCTELLPPPDLERYLDLLRSRALIGLGVSLDIGASGTDIERRCRRALQSLWRHGWVVITPRPATRSTST